MNEAELNALCERHAYCCTLSPRCDDCPKPCIREKLVCCHREGCIQFKAGKPKAVRCDNCKRLLTRVNEDGETELYDYVLGFSQDCKRLYIYCIDCTFKMMGKNKLGNSVNTVIS
jgi:hypothetical protein